VLSSGGSGYFTCIQNMKLVTNKFKSGGLHEKHVVATWNLGNHLRLSYYVTSLDFEGPLSESTTKLQVSVSIQAARIQRQMSNMSTKRLSNQLAQALTFLICVREIPAYNLSQCTTFT